VPASDESLQQREELLERELDAVRRQRQSMNRSDDELRVTNNREQSRLPAARVAPVKPPLRLDWLLLRQPVTP